MILLPYTLYDNHTVSATATEEGGTWTVELEMMSKNFRASESGQETAIEINDWIEVGLMEADGRGR